MYKSVVGAESYKLEHGRKPKKKSMFGKMCRKRLAPGHIILLHKINDSGLSSLGGGYLTDGNFVAPLTEIHNLLAPEYVGPEGHC